MAKIYVIDDDDQLLHMVGLMLERDKHTVTLINNPGNGIAQLEAEKPDLLVLDVMMPTISGHDLTRQIRANSKLKDIPILILTARSQTIDRDTALKIGADDYLSKPVTSKELLDHVHGLLTKKPASTSKGSVRGMVAALFGLRGGVGQTTLATNLSLALRHVSQQEVCLVDLSPSLSQTSLQLHAQTQSSWIDISANDDLDWTGLNKHLITHSSGLHLLAAPIVPQLPTMLSAERTRQIIELLRDQMMFTVLDLPPVLSPSFLAALEAANIGLHVITPDVVSVRTAVQTNRALANANIRVKQNSFVLNQISAKASLLPTTIERALGRIPFQIGFDPNQANALTKGAPLTLGTTDSPLPIVINRMADVIWKRLVAKMEKTN